MDETTSEFVFYILFTLSAVIVISKIKCKKPIRKKKILYCFKFDIPTIYENSNCIEDISNINEKLNIRKNREIIRRRRLRGR